MSPFRDNRITTLVRIGLLCGLLVALEAIAIIPSNARISDANIGTGKATPESFLATHTNHSFASNFMLSLYHNLTKGMSLNRATGRPDHWRDLRFMDTVRSFPAVGSLKLHNQLHYKFNLSAISITEMLRVTDLRLKLPQSWYHYKQFYVVATITNKSKMMYASSVSVVMPFIADDGIRALDISLISAEWLDYARSLNMPNELVAMDLVLTGVNQVKPMSRSKLLRRLEWFYENRDVGKLEESFDAILVAYTEVGDFAPNTGATPKDTQHMISENEKLLEFVSSDYDSVEATNVSTTSDGIVRNKRSQHRGTNNSNNVSDSPCRRRDLEIDFTAIGWGEWVVYPTQFNAYQCQGKCAGYADSRSNPTNHAIVQSLVRLIGREKIPMSCCTPTKLSPLSILYLEKGSVVIKHHEDMIVDECGCM